MRRDRHKRKPEGQDNLQDDTFHSAEDSVARLMFGLNFMRLPNLTGASHGINTWARRVSRRPEIRSPSRPERRFPLAGEICKDSFNSC